jgi:polyphosphate kinase 2 (PPK2 family)
MLHISKEEQRERMQERIDDPQKRWKFAAGDLAVRKQWDDYERAYGNMIAATGTPWAPWVVVPADSKTHRNLMIASHVSEALAKLDLDFPAGDPSLIGLKVV